MSWVFLFFYFLALALSSHFGAINLTLLVMPLCGSKSASFRAAAVRLAAVLLFTLAFFWVFARHNTFLYFKPYQALLDALYLDKEPWAGVSVAIPASVLLGIAVIFCVPIPVDLLLCLSMTFLEVAISQRSNGTLFSFGMVFIFVITSVCTSLFLYFLLDWFLYSRNASGCFEIAMKGYALAMGFSQALGVFTGLTRRGIDHAVIITIGYSWVIGIFSHVFLRRRSKKDAFDKYPQVASEFAIRNLNNTLNQRESRGIPPNTNAATGENPSPSRVGDSRPRRIAEAEEAGANLIILRTEELFVRPLVNLVYLNAFFNLCELPLTVVYLFFRLPSEIKPSPRKMYTFSSLMMAISFITLGYRQSSALGSRWIKLTPSQAFIAQVSVMFNYAIASKLQLPSSFCLNLLATMVVTTLSDSLRGWRPTDKAAVWRNVAMISLLLVSSIFSAVCLILIRKIQD